MFDSIKEWLNNPITINPFLSIDGAGDADYGVPISTKCYVEDKVNMVVDISGSEVRSSTTLYVDGDDNVGPLDTILYNDKVHPIKALSSLSDGDGRVSLRLVYI